MTDREKLAELLENCEELVSAFHCTYAEAADYLIAHGVTVRPMQKPLTVEELVKKPGSVWFENDTAITPITISKRKSFSDLCLKDVVYGLYRCNSFDSFTFFELTVSDYGKRWRCWAEKPTEEERKAAEWLK